MNYELRKSNLDEITRELFEEAIFLCYKDGFTSVAPLGRAGDTIMLFGENSPNRKSQVSIRNYCGDAELLITDVDGNFLFYGRYHIGIGLDFLVNHYYNIFCQVEQFIKYTVPKRPNFANMRVAPNASDTSGFAMLLAYQKCGHLY